MVEDILQIDYDQMELIAEQFQTQSDVVEQMLQSLNQPFYELQNGGWIGEGADAFFKSISLKLCRPLIGLIKLLVG